MNWPKTTAYLILFTAVLWIAYDILAYEYAGSEGTISWWFKSVGEAHPILPFGIGLVVGVLAGHWWWNVRGKRN